MNVTTLLTDAGYWKCANTIAADPVAGLRARRTGGVRNLSHRDNEQGDGAGIDSPESPYSPGAEPELPDLPAPEVTPPIRQPEVDPLPSREPEVSDVPGPYVPEIPSVPPSSPAGPAPGNLPSGPMG